MGTQLALAEKVNDPLAFITTFGTALARSGMFGCQCDEQGQIIAATCLMEGITPLDFRRTYHIVQGTPSMRSDAMLAEFRRLGGKHKVIARTPDHAEVELIDDGQSHRFSLTWEQAIKEDFTHARPKGDDADKIPVEKWPVKDNYKYPRKRMQMLWARVVSDGVRTLRPEIVAGHYTPEEVEDFGVAGEVRYTTPPPLSAEAAIAQAAGRPPEPTEPEVDDVEDVPFETQPAAVETEPDTVLQGEGGFVGNGKKKRILDAFVALKLDMDRQRKLLSKYHVDHVDKLTDANADDCLMRLENALKAAGKN